MYNKQVHIILNTININTIILKCIKSDNVNISGWFELFEYLNTN